MKSGNLKIFSPQSNEIYRLLLSKHQLTAKEIGKELHIFPNTVYRGVKKLLESGFVQKIHSYPITYQTISETEALDLYSLAFRKQFQSLFPSKATKKEKTLLDVSFIQSREDLRGNTDHDVSLAKSNVDFVVSGLEVPAETMLTYKHAIGRGVTIRALVQRLDDTSKQMFQNWKKIGLKIRYYPNIEARVFIIDQEIVYFTSYNPQLKEEAIGIRFAYKPYAKIMDEFFELRWKIAKSIDLL